MKNKLGQTGFLDNGVGLLIGVIILVGLLFLAVQVYNMFSDDAAIKKSTSEIENVQLELSNLEKNLSKTYLVSSLINSKGYDWYLVSSEFGESCGGNFCLCFCSNSECDEVVKCEPSDKFVVLRDKDPLNCEKDIEDKTLVDSRFIKIGGERVSEINLSLLDSKVYPINLEISDYDVSNGELPIDKKSIFLRFNSVNSQIEWSFDIFNWNSLSVERVESGRVFEYSESCKKTLDVPVSSVLGPGAPKSEIDKYNTTINYNQISENEKIFFQILQSEFITSDSGLEDFLKNNGFKSSNGLYIIEKIN